MFSTVFRYVLNYEKRVWFHGNLHRKTASLTVHPVATIGNLVEGLFSADFISRDFIGSDVMKEGTRLNKIISQNFSRFVLFFWFHLKFHSIEHNSINFIILLVQSRGIFHELTHLPKFSICWSHINNVHTKVVIFFVKFLELSHLICDLSQAEKKINSVVTSWANAQNDIYFTQNGRSCHFEWKIKNSCHFVTCSTCNNTYFFLNLR